ncbi:MAG: FtsQ-type POTRA domain-containing protein [Actinomycetota bacterium]|nr:FtsQ-type POTRA domain-containing protein [Actinomycetota bacterium]
MGLWSDLTKEMVRPQSVLGYPEADPRSAPPQVRQAPPPPAPPQPAAPRPSRRAPRGTAPAAKAPVANGRGAPGGEAQGPGAKGQAATGAKRSPGRAPRKEGKGDRAGGPRTGRPPMDPRIRERWVSVRREQGHRRLRAAVVAAAAVAIIAAAVGAAFSPLLAVGHVRVAATAHVPVGQVLAVTGLGNHRPMVEVNAASEVSRLDTLPWVASARVSREWPSTVAVTVRERRPVAQVTVTGGVVDVDATGRVLTQPQAATAGLPTLVGSPAAGPPGTWVPGTGLPGTGRRSPVQGSVGASLAVASALPAPVANRVSTVTMDGRGVITLALTPEPTTVTLGEVAAPGDPAEGPAVTGSSVPVALARQVAALSTLLATVDLSKVAQIDLTVPDRPALTPAQTPTTLSTTSRG